MEAFDRAEHEHLTMRKDWRLIGLSLADDTAFHDTRRPQERFISWSADLESQSTQNKTGSE